MKHKVTVSTTVNATIEEVWKIWNDPEHICQWCSAHPDWHTPKAKNDLRVGGKISTRMEAKDGSTGFDWNNTYDIVENHKTIQYHMEDGRVCRITFAEQDGKVTVTQVFDPESENTLELQQEGWQAIMDNFRIYMHTLR